MKVLTAQQIRDWDSYTTETRNTSFLQLMENAAHACTNWMVSRLLHYKPVRVFCGKGNNGGDGLAMARMLLQQGADVHVYILELGNEGTESFKTNLSRLITITSNISYIQSTEFLPLLNKEDVVIDCLYGTGLNRGVSGLSADLIEHINRSGVTVVSVDLPSGMFADQSSLNSVVVKATYTLTFETTKLCFLVSENATRFGEVHVLSIGLDDSYLETVQTAFTLLQPQRVKQIWKKRTPFSHKGHYGHAFIVAGSRDKMGAAVLCVKACARSGAGLVTACVPEECFNTLNITVPEAMLHCNDLKQFSELDKYAAIGIGPGLGMEATAKRMINSVISLATKGLVIDADAINTLASIPGSYQNLKEDCIITPHPREFDRLFGQHENGFERIEKAIELSILHPFVIVLKDHHTLVVKNGRGYFNSTGNAGLAKGGSGDVLTGIITGLKAQGYTSLDSAILGVYLHGLAADICQQHQTEETMLPSDVINCLGPAFKALRQEE